MFAVILKYDVFVSFSVTFYFLTNMYSAELLKVSWTLSDKIVKNTDFVMCFL